MVLVVATASIRKTYLLYGFLFIFFFFCTNFPFVQFYNKLIVGIIHYAYYTGEFEMQWSHSVVWHMAYIEDV